MDKAKKVDRDERDCVVVAVTTRASLLLMKGVLERWKAEGYRPVFVCGDRVEKAEVGAETLQIPMGRDINPLRDFKAVLAMRKALLKLKPVMVDASTPKAGLVVTLAARLADVPVRLYTLRGLPLETAKGLRRLIYWCSEKLAVACATHVVCVSESLRNSAVEKRLLSVRKAEVVGHGSSNGVDTEYFQPGACDRHAVEAMRERLAWPEDALVFGYIGRIHPDKGLVDLLEAWEIIRSREPRARLLLVGPNELLSQRLLEKFNTMLKDDRVVWLGNQGDVRPCYELMDAFLFPSHREGFPNVLLESTAMQVPPVAYRVTGCQDAVRQTMTGLLVEPGDVKGFAEGALTLLEQVRDNPKFCQDARNWVVENFERQRHQDRLFERYLSWVNGV